MLTNFGTKKSERRLIPFARFQTSLAPYRAGFSNCLAICLSNRMRHIRRRSSDLRIRRWWNEPCRPWTASPPATPRTPRSKKVDARIDVLDVTDTNAVMPIGDGLVELHRVEFLLQVLALVLIESCHIHVSLILWLIFLIYYIVYSVNGLFLPTNGMKSNFLTKYTHSN